MTNDAKIEDLERRILYWEGYLAKERERLDQLEAERLEPFKIKYRILLGLDH